jgi:hypothetical protein
MSIALGTNTRGSGAGAGTQGTTGTITTQATGSAFLVATMIGNVVGTVCWTDNFGNTYTQVGTEQNNAGQGIRCNMYICANGAGGAGHQWTQAFADRFTTTACYAVEITGAATSSILDVVAQGNTGATFNFPITTTVANSAIFSICRFNPAGTPTAHGSFTLLDSAANSFDTAIMYRLVTAAGAYDPVPTDTAANASAWITANFKEASGSVVVPPMYYQTRTLYFI